MNQYSYGSACSTSSGRLYFGTSRGLVGFTPPERTNRAPLKLFITEISANGPNGPFPVTEKGRSTLHTQKIRLRYKDLSSLTIRYAAPDFQSSRTGLFQTVLEGKRRSIQSYSYSGETTYTDLAPGKYQFRVNGVGARREASRTLDIEIRPPFYRSPLAFILYVLAALLILGILARQWDHIRQMRMSREVEKLQTEQQKELYDAKINFFTNITHEIRTPLSLIKMPLDKIISSGNYTESNRQELLTMQANAERLLSLTNQLLDLRKMEKMEVKPTFLPNDLAALVRKTCDRFTPVAKDQHIQLDTTLNAWDHEVQIEHATFEAYKLLEAACREKGVIIHLDSVYRSVEAQKELWLRFENEYGATFCKECGVNLKVDDSKNSKSTADDKFKVVKKRQSYPTPSENSIKAKLMYKHDKYDGRLRIAKTKCATIVVFSAFFIFSFAISLFTQNIVVALFVALIFGIVFAIPTFIVGHVLGTLIDRIFH